MVVCVECLPADTPWGVVSVTRRSSGVAPRACVRVYARVLVPPNLYIHTYIHCQTTSLGTCCRGKASHCTSCATFPLSKRTSGPMNEARLSHLPFWGPSEGFFLINSTAIGLTRMKRSSFGLKVRVKPWVTLGERFIRVNPTDVELKLRTKTPHWSLGPPNGKWLKRASFIGKVRHFSSTLARN